MVKVKFKNQVIFFFNVIVIIKPSPITPTKLPQEINQKKLNRNFLPLQVCLDANND